MQQHCVIQNFVSSLLRALKAQILGEVRPHFGTPLNPSQPLQLLLRGRQAADGDAAGLQAESVLSVENVFGEVLVEPVQRLQRVLRGLEPLPEGLNAVRQFLELVPKPG